MGDQEPASVTRVRALNRLKTALKRVGLASAVNSFGTSRIVLQISSLGVDVDCLTNARDDHRWWFWLDGEPIAPADQPSAAVEAIKTQTRRQGDTTTAR